MTHALEALRAALPDCWLLQPFRVGWYQAAVDPQYRLPGADDALGVLVANHRGAWEAFLAAVTAQPALARAPHPFDQWTEAVVVRALAAVGVPYDVRWAPEPPPRRVAMQRLAHVSGLAPLSRMHLNVHPVYGPWLGLRAAIVLDAPGPGGLPPPEVVGCTACDHACQPVLEQALAAGSDWRRWVAVRDACPVGREHRYSDDQIRYHYTKDRAVLLSR